MNIRQIFQLEKAKVLALKLADSIEEAPVLKVKECLSDLADLYHCISVIELEEQNTVKSKSYIQ